MSIDNHHHHQYLHQHPANIFVATTTNSASIGCSSISSSSGGSNSNSMSKAAVTATVAVAEGTGTNSSTTSTSTSTSTSLTAQQVLTDLLAKIKDVDLADLVPPSVRFELDQLELELLEGDITQKGYDKKRAKILMPYAADIVLKMNDKSSASSSSSPSSAQQLLDSSSRGEALSVISGVKVKSDKIRIQRKHKNNNGTNHRDDANANRYHSEIRQEAVKAALAMYSNQKQSVIVSSKRNTTYLTPTAANETSAATTSENPFPVNHINDVKLMSSSNLSTDEETSDEELNEIIESVTGKSNGNGKCDKENVISSSGNKVVLKTGTFDKPKSDRLVLSPTTPNKKKSPSQEETKVAANMKSDLNQINDFLNNANKTKSEIENILTSPLKTPIKRTVAASQDSINENEVKVDILLSSNKTSTAAKTSENSSKAGTAPQSSCDEQKSSSSPSSSNSSSSARAMSPPITSTSKTAATAASEAANCHVNQYYYHVQPQQSASSSSASQQQQQQHLYFVNRANYYVPHQKTDRVVAIKNHHITNQSNSFFMASSAPANGKMVSGGLGNATVSCAGAATPSKDAASKENGAVKKLQRTQMIEQQNRIKSIEEVKKQHEETTTTPAIEAPNPPTQTNKSNQPVSSASKPATTPSLNQSISSDNGSNDIRQQTRVSAKIQQLLNTLKRPKRRPLNEYFEDNQEEVNIPPLDPAVPKPEGGVSVPACGEPLVVAPSFPQSIEAAIHKFANASSKATCISVVDQYGKVTGSLTYVKLLNRSQKVAYHLLNTKFQQTYSSSSTSTNSEVTLKQGDRVALVFTNTDPIGFIVSFCACLMAGLVALPIDVPLARRDAGSQSLGFLLGQVGASLVLTSEMCYKALPKNANNDVVEFKGWPRVPWLVVENLTKSPPKDWAPPNRIPSDAIAYIEYSSLRDGSVTGVAVTRDEMLSHCQTLNVACQYIEGECSVCVLDYKREFGLWHGIQCTIFNGLHTLYVPYATMKINPSIWLSLITKYKATVALVKSRDMHWGLMASRDHNDINLSSLRMLLVADGANPWSLSSCDTFLDVFQSKGLRAEAICPTAGSSETLTLSIRRPNRSGPQSSGRGVLSMSGLSYGVVRVDQENSLTSLTLQDVGQVLPGSLVSVVRLNTHSPPLNSQNPTGTNTSTSTTTTMSSNSSSSGGSNNQPHLCQTDEVGEICISAKSTADRYFGLQGLTSTVFKVIPHGSDNLPIGNHEFVRSGLLGFLGPGGLVFVCGSKEGLIEVGGRRHNTDDIIATVLAVEPMKFIYRGRIAVFSTKVLKDERIVIVAEQRPDASEEECFQWMSRVLQAVDSIHHVGVYCLALVPPNTLPKTPLGGIHLPETRAKFLDGSLHPTNILMCPHTCVLNLPKPREHHPEREVGPSAVLAGSIVQGRRLAEAKGRDLFDDESDTAKKYQYLGDILRWRSATNPDHVLYTMINSKGQETHKMTCAQLHKKAERVACLLLERGQLSHGDHVALIFPPGVDLVAAFYGCLYVGIVPVPVRPPHAQNIQTTLPTIKMIVEMSRIKAILTLAPFIKLFKSKEANAIIDSRQWPTLLDVDENTKKKLSTFFRPSAADRICYLDFSVSTTGMLAGVQMSHASSTALCRAIKLSCELYPSREVVLCLDPYSGLGFALWCLNSVYSGHHSILVPPVEVEINPCIWLATVSHYKVRDTFCSYSVMELCTKGLRSSVIELKTNNYPGLSSTLSQSPHSASSSTLSLSSFSFLDSSANSSGTLLKRYLKSRGINLSCVRTCAIVAEERPRIQLTSSFIKLFQSLGLPARSVSTTFGCRANIAICLQGASDPDPTPVYVDQRALRNDRVTIVEKGSPHSLCLLESGKLLPGVKVVIANPETKGQCADSHLGEIWVQSPQNSNGYYNIYGDNGGASNAVTPNGLDEHFNCRLATGDTTSVYARTGYLGFVRRIESEMLSSVDTPHDAIYIVGSLDETLMIRGMRYHPIDIETTVLRAHKKICECACFTWTNLLVVVVELDGPENEALDLIPLVTNSVLEEHYLIVGVVVVVDPGVVPINSRGEKQRMHLRDGFLSDLLDPIYVAYNM